MGNERWVPPRESKLAPDSVLREWLTRTLTAIFAADDNFSDPPKVAITNVSSLLFLCTLRFYCLRTRILVDRVRPCSRAIMRSRGGDREVKGRNAVAFAYSRVLALKVSGQESMGRVSEQKCTLVAYFMPTVPDARSEHP